MHVSWTSSSLRTWKLKLPQPPTTSQVMLVLVDFSQPSAILLVLKVLLPVLLRTMRRPAAVRTLELDSLGLGRCMAIKWIMM